MVLLLVIALFVVLSVHEALGGAWLAAVMSDAGRWWAVGLGIVPHVLLAAVGALAVASAGRSMDTASGASVASAHDFATRSIRLTHLAAVLWYTVSVVVIGWAEAVRGLIGDMILVDEWAIIAPPIVVMLAGWWALGGIERRVREAMLYRGLHEGRPLYSIPSRVGFAWQSARHQLMPVLIPASLITAWSESVAWAGPHAADWFGIHAPDAPLHAGVAAAMAAAQLAGVVVVFALMPAAIRLVWDTVPLTAGPLAELLADVCRRNAVRVARVLVWRTHGSLHNAAVMGVFAPLRYILVTDGLIESLRERELEAVASHEVGHVRERHLIWLALSTMAAVGGFATALALGAEWLMPDAASGGTLQAGLAVASLIGGLVVFGFVSRRFEWQADAFAAKDLSRAPRPLPDGLPAQAADVVTGEAAAALIGALGEVAALNGLDPRTFTWRHGSIVERQLRLRALVGTPLNSLPIDRIVRRLKLVTAAALALAVAHAVYATWRASTPTAQVAQRTTP